MSPSPPTLEETKEVSGYMYGDTAAIRRLATLLREQSDELRADAESLLGAAEQVLWEGQAATAMRTRAQERAGDLRDTAEAHDEAAEALLQHAAEVDRLTEAIASIAQRVAQLTDDLPDIDLPTPGHLDWLQIPDQLRDLWP